MGPLIVSFRALGVAPKIYEAGQDFPQAFSDRWQGDQPLEGAYFYYDAMALLAVAQGKADRGILFCSTGVGMSIGANNVRGDRAALASNADAVCLTRAHNDANVLAIGARYTDETTAAEYVNLFLDTPFDGGRHARRLEKVAAIEAEEAAGAGCRSGS